MHRYREMFRVAGDYCFNQLKESARTHVKKQKVINVMISAGFRVEGPRLLPEKRMKGYPAAETAPRRQVPTR